MRRLRRFLPPNQEKEQDTDDNHQNSTDQDQSMWHCLHYLAMMLHQEERRAQEVNGLIPCFFGGDADSATLAA
jgi:hypothetical protein